MSREPTLNDGAKTCWEDFAVGDRWETGAHEVTKEEILAFGRQYDPEPFHRDEDGGKGVDDGRADRERRADGGLVPHAAPAGDAGRGLDSVARLGRRQFRQSGASGRRA